MPADREPTPLACTLTPADHAARAEWIKELSETALRGYRREGNRLRLGYHPAAAADVRELIRRERECCPFLRFATEEGPEEFVVIVEAPTGLGTAAEAAFAPHTGGRTQ